MFLRTSRRRLAGGLAVVVGALTVGVLAPAPAHATHVSTLCNNDPSGIDELYAEWNNLFFVGIDAGLAGIGPGEARAVCIEVLGTSSFVFVTVPDPDPTSIGRTVRISICTNTSCNTIEQTGVEVNIAAPLFTCIWIDGVQQNPAC